MMSVSFLSYFHRSLVGLLACLMRGVDGLRGLCVALRSRLIASGASGILFLVPCDGFLSAFLFLALLLYERLYFCRSLALAPPRLPFFGGIRTRAIFFYRLPPPCLLVPSSLSLISCLALLLIASCSTVILLRLPNIVPSLAPPVRHGERGDYGYEMLACGRNY